MSAIDYAILVIYLVIVSLIGWRFRMRGVARDEDYFLAARGMGWFPIGLSVMITVFSAINYLAFPNEVFGYGLYVVVALPVFFLAAWPITKIWMPFFHDMKLTSAYEYLERRFDIRVRSLASGVFILWRLFWMATALYATSTIMSLLTGISPWVIIFISGIVATAYTFLGGMRAVMWTDVCQFFILFGGIILGMFFSLSDSSLSEIITIAYNSGRLKPFAPFDPMFLSFDPQIRITLWSGILGTFVAFLARYGADQVVMQRYFTARNLRMAQRGLWLNAGISVLSLSLLAIFGMAVFTHAVKTGALSSVDWNSLSALQRKGAAMKQMAAMIHSFPVGISGLVVAGLLAATMSSIDSGINACSAAYITDFHKRFCKNAYLSENTSLRLDKSLTLGVGVSTMFLALVLIPLVSNAGGLFAVMNKIINGLGSPLLALMIFGMFSRSVNAPGMFYGGLIGVFASLAVSLFVETLALHYYAVVNLLLTLVPCYVFSRIVSYCGHVQSEEKMRWTWFAWRRRMMVCAEECQEKERG